MEASLKQYEASTKSLEEQVNASLANRAVAVTETCALLKQYRTASEVLILDGLLTTLSHDAETRLWAAHSRVNSHFRKELSRLRKDGMSKPVETRKYIKVYLEFLKDSQRFYRELIQKLNARYGPIHELKQIAQLVGDVNDSAANDASSPLVQQRAVQSCHMSLICLGDLSRYRATERLDKTPDWGPAIGYYGLAGTLCPSSGKAYHQQSVIAFEEGDHFRATYYLYRSIVVDEPHPNALSNLELEFKKVRKAWSSGELVSATSPNDRNGHRNALASWIIRLHSKCFTGQAFKGYEELESEVLTRVQTELKSTTMDGTVSKICYINFAAQYNAASHFQNQPDQMTHMQSCLSYLRLNLNTLSCFLRLLYDELEHSRGEVLPQSRGRRDAASGSITPSMTRLLPLLRLSSAWLLTNDHLLNSEVGDNDLRAATNELWHTYARALSALIRAFPVVQLPEVTYLLEEDVESLGFKPLLSNRSQKLWKAQDSQKVKPKFTDGSVNRLDQEQEMLARIRDVLIDGLLLAVAEGTPITFDDPRFVFNPAISSQLVATETDLGPRQETSHPQKAHMPQQQPLTVNDNQDAQLSRMVDDLVGTSDGEQDHQLNGNNVYRESKAADPLDNRKHSGSMTRTVPSRQTSSRGSIEHLGGHVGLDDSFTIWKQPSTPHMGQAMQRPQSGSAGKTGVPSGYQTPRHRGSLGHSRVPSESSVRSVASGSLLDNPSSFAPTVSPYSNTTAGMARAPADRLSGRYGSIGRSGLDSGMNSPLLFGAGGGPWSPAPRGSISNATPPNGQGG